jgi:hypothetical protein
MKHAINIRDLLEAAIGHNGELHVSASLDLEDLFNGNAIPEETELDIDIHELLAEQCQIAVVWSIEDVHQVRPDLTDDQCWEVLERASRKHDAGIGITWDVLKCHADDLFGDAPESQETAED